MVLILALLLVLILFGAGFAVHFLWIAAAVFLFSGSSASPLAGARGLEVTASIGGRSFSIKACGRCRRSAPFGGLSRVYCPVKTLPQYAGLGSGYHALDLRPLLDAITRRRRSSAFVTG